MFLIAQVFGVFSTIAAILCVQAKTSGGVLLGQILANGFSGLSYALLGSLSGAWVCILAAIHSVLISLIRKQKEPVKEKGIIFPVVKWLASFGSVLLTPERFLTILKTEANFLFAREEAIFPLPTTLFILP